ncbi:MAG: DUF882 domain-containing protein [Desulfobulbus sp.]|nr:MAG: DUF882 domain-containing protein [Desulfobulbus sp.]
MSRRRFVTGAISTATGLLLCSALPAWATGKSGNRSLTFYNTHTEEQLRVTYARNNAYDQAALRKVNLFLRDHRTDDVHPIDPKLLDILYAVQRAYGDNGIFEVISGYRSPQSNARLRRGSWGVARKSLHMVGRAIDVRRTGMKTRTLREIALELQRGGVGYYAKSDFVHLDTGRFRTW